MKELEGFIKRHNPKIEIAGVGTTGSARYLAGVIVGADLIKNEITAHAKGVVKFVPNVRTVIEIGGQDSKIIILENGVVTDFAMNLVCSAGTGAFLEAQAFRLGIPVEKFGELALKSKNPTHIGSRCSVFAEYYMVKYNDGLNVNYSSPIKSISARKYQYWNNGKWDSLLLGAWELIDQEIKKKRNYLARRFKRISKNTFSKPARFC